MWFIKNTEHLIVKNTSTEEIMKRCFFIFNKYKVVLALKKIHRCKIVKKEIYKPLRHAIVMLHKSQLRIIND